MRSNEEQHVKQNRQISLHHVHCSMCIKLIPDTAVHLKALAWVYYICILKAYGFHRDSTIERGHLMKGKINMERCETKAPMSEPRKMQFIGGA